VRKAIQNLIERASSRSEGKGTFVTQPKITQEPDRADRFRRGHADVGANPDRPLLDKRIVAADEVVAHHLALAPGTLVVRLQRVRLADGVAMSFDETYLLANRGERCGQRPRGRAGLRMLEDKVRYALVEAEYKLGAAAANPVAAQGSKCRPAADPPIERTSYTTGNRPVDYERLHYRGDLIRFVERPCPRPRAPTQTEAPKMNAGFGAWLFGMSLGAGAPGGMLASPAARSSCWPRRRLSPGCSMQ